MNNLITLYILNKKQNTYLIVFTLVAITLILLRVKLTHTIYLLFLLWNLFLAVIPYSISSLIKTDFSLKKYNLKNLLLQVTWLLFIPNTYYLITDFVHLHHNSLPQFAFDFLLLSCFTIAGFYCGMLSIYTLFNQIQFFYKNKIAIAFTITISYLCAFGIYIGRILRFNSWDIISKPITLLTSITESVFQIEAIDFTLELGTLITIVNLMYIKFKSNH